MTVGVAHLVMELAVRCLPDRSRGWGQAMRAEFGLAVQDGRSLGFALGCLVATLRQMPFQSEGRLALTSHALVLGLIVPIATFHLGCALSGVKFMLSGQDQYHAMLAADAVSNGGLADAYRAATPALTVLLLLLGFAHLLIAWLILDRQWRRATIIWLVAAATSATIVGVIAAIGPSVGGIAIQLAALAIELAAIPFLAACQTRHASVHPS